MTTPAGRFSIFILGMMAVQKIVSIAKLNNALENDPVRSHILIYQHT
jgi:hypothetical protein